MDTFYSVSLGPDAAITTAADDALAWLQTRTLGRLPLNITRVTIDDGGRSTDTTLLAYAGHRGLRKMKPKHHKRGRRKEIKRRRNQERKGGKA